MLGRRITDPGTLQQNLLYKVRTGRFTLSFNQLAQHQFADTRGPPISRDTYFLKQMAGYPNIYRFLERGTGRIYQLFFHWPQQLISHLARLVFANMFPPNSTFDQGINVCG